MWQAQEALALTAQTWHYSRSTHFGLTYAGACGFGLYGLCTTAFTFTDPTLASVCTLFCTNFPDLCADPAGTTLRGNFAAPNGDYYTQFIGTVPGNPDNYLSCGECFELIKTKPDGTDYAVGETGYTVPITLEIVDSCPCNANAKWCCGPGVDHCGEINFKYGCPLPDGSHHMDLSDIAMARLQTGNANGLLIDGVIPTRYLRVTCPKVGNAYIWLRDGAGPYWFSLSVVNTAKLGGVAIVEAQLPNGTWVSMVHDPNYSSSRPQERYGAWVVPQGSGPFPLPLALRVTDVSGAQLLSASAITSWSAANVALKSWNYVNLGVQF